jgi:hypothetical protein
MNKFHAGVRYRHDTAKDLDIEVVKVRYQDSKRVKLLIRWVSMTTGKVVTFPGQRFDGVDKIEIQSKDYQYWNSTKAVN